MSASRQTLRDQAVYIFAIVVIVIIYHFTRLPALSDSERASLASRFSFSQVALPEVQDLPMRSVRQVHPSLEHFKGWISSVGASVALNDLDGDGVSNDVCYVDTRSDAVIVAPVPGTSMRYKPFTLNPSPVVYDPATTAPMGCLPGDVNEDGLVDIIVYYWGRTPIAFLRKQVAGANDSPLSQASYVPFEIMPEGGRWYTNAGTLADLDGDGHLDLIIGNYFPDGARILDAKAGGVEQMQDSMSRAFNGGRNRLMLWAGATSGASPTVRFKDAEGVFNEQVANAWTLAVGAADLDGDLLPEIYFANDFGPDRLLHNLSTPGNLRFALLEGKKDFTTPSSKVLGHDSFKGMGVDFGDINGDGILDMYVSNIASQYALEESHYMWISTGDLQQMKKGIAPYVDQSEPLGVSRSGWGWEARLADFDNDGVYEALQGTGFMKGDTNRWPELHEVAMGNDQLLHSPRSWHRFQPGDDIGGQTHNPFFVRARDGRYYDLAREIGLAQPQVTRGIATADVDCDGLLDFAVANQWGQSFFYHNQSSRAGNFLALNVLLPLRKQAVAQTTVTEGHSRADIKGRAAIGAFATVYLPDGRTLVAQVDGGAGHSGKRSPELHFGLAGIDRSASLTVEFRWRDPEGKPRKERLELRPGWHTVLLGW